MHVRASYNINNQKKTIKTKRKENLTLFGSIHHTASPLKPVLGDNHQIKWQTLPTKSKVCKNLQQKHNKA